MTPSRAGAWRWPVTNSRSGPNLCISREMLDNRVGQKYLSDISALTWGVVVVRREPRPGSYAPPGRTHQERVSVMFFATFRASMTPFGAAWPYAHERETDSVHAGIHRIRSIGNLKPHFEEATLSERAHRHLGERNQNTASRWESRTSEGISPD